MSNKHDQEVSVVATDVRVVYETSSSDPDDDRGSGLKARLARQQKVEVHALKGVSLAARHGESVGIIGTNGSGKSTLLRTIAGLEAPTSGQVLTRSVPVLLGVNAALIPNMSGAENVQLGCLAMGMTPTEAKDALPEVIELAGIGRSIYRPMRTYSSGMAARLRFAIAMCAKPEILLIDEALSTGDAAFKERSSERMNQMLDEAGTVFLVSHAAQTIEEMCTRAVWLHNGEVVLDGPAKETARRYRLWAWKLAKGEPEEAVKLFDAAMEERKETRIFLDRPDTPLDRERPTPLPRHARR